jgi:ubiquinone/menaquinone biosynthesis C-methylase UbiE
MSRTGRALRTPAVSCRALQDQLLVEHQEVSETLFMEHWIDIDPERLARYETMYTWSAAAEDFYAPADIRSGHLVVDFGCGPGHTAIEFARRVGRTGHVFALDVNAEFIKRTQSRAAGAGFGDRITVQLLTSERLPLADAAVDRVTARNTMIYVRDPLKMFEEFRRALKPGGIAHAIEGDWSLTVVEPLGSEWRLLVAAASWAWRTPEIGRKLYAIARSAGFSQVVVTVQAKPDTDGRLLNMVRTVADYARKSGAVNRDRVDALLEKLDRGLADGTYLVVAPQFVVTATR